MLLVVAAGCSRKHYDSRLSDIALTVATSPDDALARLDSIDPRGLALIREAIDTNKILSDDDIIWTSLADIIRETAPDFFIKLDFLNRRPVSPMDSHIIVLTRFGIQPSTISELLGRAKSTISGRRADLCKNLFHDAISLKQFGNAVRVI